MTTPEKGPASGSEREREAIVDQLEKVFDTTLRPEQRKPTTVVNDSFYLDVLVDSKTGRFFKFCEPGGYDEPPAGLSAVRVTWEAPGYVKAALEADRKGASFDDNFMYHVKDISITKDFGPNPTAHARGLSPEADSVIDEAIERIKARIREN